MATATNLKDAFAGESQANRMYTAFARKADAEGFKQIAKLFRAAAAAETVHALAHLRAMGGVKSTVENLQKGVDGEAHEFREMYPPFLAGAIADGHKAAEISFKYALAVEEVHHTLYSDALALAQAGKDLPPADIFVCENCGYTVAGEAPDRCPVCGASRPRFTKVE